MGGAAQVEESSGAPSAEQEEDQEISGSFRAAAEGGPTAGDRSEDREGAGELRSRVDLPLNHMGKEEWSEFKSWIDNLQNPGPPRFLRGRAEAKAAARPGRRADQITKEDAELAKRIADTAKGIERIGPM